MASVRERTGAADPSDEVEVGFAVDVPGRERPVGTSLRHVRLVLEEVVRDIVLVVDPVERPARHAEAVVKVEPDDSRVDAVCPPGAREARDEVVGEPPQERMLQPANVERLDVTVGYRFRLLKIRLFAVIRGEILGYKIAPVLIPAHLIGMAELAGLERELPRVARPCARPFDTLLEGNPVEVQICGRDLARGAVGMREVEDVRIRLLRRRDEVCHHLPEVAGVSAAEIFRLVRPLRKIAVHSHVDHRDARPVAVAPEVLRLDALELLALLARLQERDFRVPVERRGGNNRGDAVLGKVFERSLVDLRIEFRPVRVLYAVVSDALQELRPKPVAAEVVRDTELLLVSVHENLLPLPPYLAEPELHVFIGTASAVDLHGRLKRVQVAAAKLPGHWIRPLHGRPEHVLAWSDIVSAGELPDGLPVRVQHLCGDLRRTFPVGCNGDFDGELFLAPRRAGKHVVDRDGIPDDEHRRILLELEVGVLPEQEHVELVHLAIAQQRRNVYISSRLLDLAGSPAVHKHDDTAAADTVLLERDAPTFPLRRDGTPRAQPDAVVAGPVAAPARRRRIPRWPLRLGLEHLARPPLAVPEMPLSPLRGRHVGDRLGRAARRPRVPVLLDLLAYRFGCRSASGKSQGKKEDSLHAAIILPQQTQPDYPHHRGGMRVG